MQNTEQPTEAGKLKFCAPLNERTLVGRNMVDILKKKKKKELFKPELKSVHIGYSD